jgi:glycosyltransferase involved in cell wall biosynthesis
VGGSESSIHGLCLALKNHHVEISVLANWALRQTAGLSYLGASLRRRHRQWIHDEPYGYPVYRTRNFEVAVPQLIKDVKPDIVVINSGLPMHLATVFTSLGVPTLVYIRDAEFHTWGGAFCRDSLVGYVTTSQALASRVEETFGVRPICVPPIVIPELYKVNSSRRNVTFVGPVPVKGLDIALDLAAHRPDIPFAFVESWPISKHFRYTRNRQIRQVPNITLHKPTQDMRSIYRNAKLVLVPSQWFEGWGRIVSEAQVSGIPILASNIGGLPEAVGPGGILLDPNAKVETWASALSQLWDDTSEYEQRSYLALSHASRPEFQPDFLAMRLLSVITEFIGAGTISGN